MSLANDARSQENKKRQKLPSSPTLLGTPVSIMANTQSIPTNVCEIMAHDTRSQPKKSRQPLLFCACRARFCWCPGNLPCSGPGASRSRGRRSPPSCADNTPGNAPRLRSGQEMALTNGFMMINSGEYWLKPVVACCYSLTNFWVACIFASGCKTKV